MLHYRHGRGAGFRGWAGAGRDAADNGLGKENLPAIVGATAFVPAFFAAGGERAGFAFIDFFTAQIRNRNTRAAYAVAVRTFCSWAEARELTIETLRTHHVAAYVELLASATARPPPSSTWPPSACCATGWSSARSSR